MFRRDDGRTRKPDPGDMHIKQQVSTEVCGVVRISAALAWSRYGFNRRDGGTGSEVQEAATIETQIFEGLMNVFLAEGKTCTLMHTGCEQVLGLLPHLSSKTRSSPLAKSQEQPQ